MNQAHCGGSSELLESVPLKFMYKVSRVVLCLQEMEQAYTDAAKQPGLSEEHSRPPAAKDITLPGQASRALPAGQRSNENSAGKGSASARKRMHAAVQPLAAQENSVVKRQQPAWTQASDDSDDLMI